MSIMVADQFRVPNVTRGEPVTVHPAVASTPVGNYFLSNIDRVPVFVQTVYWYRATTTRVDDVAKVIKDALSKVLVHYYPLTGRLAMSPQGKLSISFDGDRGVLFVDAEADCCLDDIGDDLNHLCFDVVQKMVYSPRPGATGFEVFGLPLLMVQVTKFKCGGFALGLVANHCPMDGVSAIEFVNSWGEVSRGLPMSVQPFFDRTVLKSREPPHIKFPHIEYAAMEDKSSSTNASLVTEEFVHKSFCFDPSMIARIKAEASSPKHSHPCTTFEALATFVWKARTKALGMASDQMTKLLVPVDIRNKVDPPLPKGYFGNGIYFAGTTCLAGKVVDQPLSYLVGLIQESINVVTNEYVRSGIDYVEVTGSVLASNYTMTATKWSRGLNFEKADFGWGPPAAFVPVGSSIDDPVVFLSAGADKRSVRFFVTLKASAMETFERLVALG
ncbi:Omega-hydroxypalmitate O-feruloyl transferase [Linum grandiflorum]